MTITKTEGGSHVFVIFLSCFAALGGLTFGYGTAIVSGAMLQIKYEFALSTVWHESIVSITLASAALSSAFSGVLVDRYGRKPAIMLSSCLFTVGSVISALSESNGKVTLLVGRLITGFGIGCSTMAVPLYMSEVAPAAIRGSLLTLYALFVTTGILLSSIVAGLFSKDEIYGWRYMFGIGGIPGAVQFFGFILLPETPHWLVRQGKNEEARKQLNKIRRTTEIDKEFSEILHSSSDDNTADEENFIQILWKMLHSKPVRKALFLGCILQLYQQFCGINTVIYYSGSILRMSGFGSDLAIWLACIPYAVNVAFTCVGIYTADKLGRRQLTMISLTGLVVASIILGVGFQLTDIHSPLVLQKDNTSSTNCNKKYSTCVTCISDSECGFCWEDERKFSTGQCLKSDPVHPERYALSAANDTSGNSCNCTQYEDGTILWGYDFCPSDYSWVAVIGLVLFVAFFAPGIGPLSWTINSEIYPLWARGTGISLATSVKWIANLIVSMTFLTLTEYITTYGTFYMYGAISLSGVLVLFFMLPETRGKSLKEVEELFRSDAKTFSKDATGQDNIAFESTYL